MTPDESIAYVKQFADAVGSVIGSPMTVASGTLTPEADGYDGEDCTLPDGKPGWQYSLVWTGPAVSDPQSVIGAIQSKWKALGEDLKIQTAAQVTGDKSDTALILSDPPYLQGTYDDGYVLTLHVSTAGTSVLAQTHCVPIPKKKSDG